MSSNENEEEIQRFWELAISTYEISPELSRSMISNMLHLIKENNIKEPDYFKKTFCFKCFSLFQIGKNCKVIINRNRKHPNLKIVEYHCMNCQNIQRINVLRSKTPKPIVQEEKPNEISVQKTKRVQQRKHKLLMEIFS